MINRTNAIHRLIDAQAASTPGNIAVTMGDVHLSYAGLSARGRNLAAGLHAMGLREGDRIAYLGKTHPRVCELLVAASIAGCAFVPLNWRLAPAEVRAILAGCRPALLLFEPQFAEMAGGASSVLASATLLDCESGTYAGLYDDADLPDAARVVDDLDRVVVQLYTSGTTGLPKGVMLTHRNLTGLRNSGFEPTPDWQIPGEDDVFLISLPMFHVAGICAMLDILGGLTGGKIIFARDFDPQLFADLLAADAVTRLCLVPAMMRAILDSVPPEHCRSPRLRHVVYGASPITDALRRDFLERFDADLIQLYGLTETSGYVTCLDGDGHCSNDPNVCGSIGRPVSGVEIKVVNTEGKPVGDGDAGEIWIRSVANMIGYFERPDASAEALTEDGWLRTGDAGFIAPGGFIVLRDRIKNMIISGGENIYPAEVESAISTCPGVAEVAVIGVPDERWGEVARAIIVKARDDVRADEIIAWARERVAGYKVPRSVGFVDSLPRNPSGKILHRVLRDMQGAE